MLWFQDSLIARSKLIQKVYGVFCMTVLMWQRWLQRPRKLASAVALMLDPLIEPRALRALQVSLQVINRHPFVYCNHATHNRLTFPSQVIPVDALRRNFNRNNSRILRPPSTLQFASAFQGVSVLFKQRWLIAIWAKITRREESDETPTSLQCINPSIGLDGAFLWALTGQVESLYLVARSGYTSL